MVTQTKQAATVMLMMFLSACAAPLAAKPTPEPLVLVDHGVARAIIVVADEPTDNARNGAKALQQVVQQMTDVELAIKSEGKFQADEEKIAVLVGPSTLAGKWAVDVKQDRDGEGDHYIVKTGARYVALIGNDDLELLGTEYAVYDLLQRLGCGWDGPDPIWHVIPRTETLTVPPLNVDERPTFKWRWIWLAAKYPTLKAAWRLGGHGVAVGDAMNRLVLGDMTRVEYKKHHPEHWLENARQPCLTNQEVIEIVAAKLRQSIEKQGPNRASLSIGPNDNDAMCPCRRCKAIGNYSAQVVNFGNQVAAKLDQTHKGQYELCFLAYWVTHSPPCPAIEHHRSISVMMVNSGNHMLAWDEQEPPDIKPYGPRNPREVAAFAGWRKTGSLTGIYEWWIPACNDPNWAAVPWYSGDSHLRNLRYWKRGGVRDVMYETNFERTDGYPQRWPLYYVGARGLWDPQLTSSQIMTEACRKLYGPAAEPMFQFYDVLEKAMVDACKVKKLGTKTWHLPSPDLIYGPNVEAQASAYLERAAKATDNAAILARISDEQKMWSSALATMAKLREAQPAIVAK